MYSNIKEVIEFALNNEYDSHKLYTSLSETVENPKAKETLLKIANDELHHAEYLKKYIIDDFKGFDSPHNSINNASQLTEFTTLKDNPQPKEVIEYAIANEVKSNKLYKLLESLSRNSDSKSMFSKLADMEEGHKSILEQMLNDM